METTTTTGTQTVNSTSGYAQPTVCPSCGHCPTCGNRRNYWHWPSYPWYPYTILCNTGTSPDVSTKSAGYTPSFIYDGASSQSWGFSHSAAAYAA